MDGIVFFRTERHDDVIDFYQEFGADVWLEQPDCTILEAGSFRFGFCDRNDADTEGIVTFVFEDRAGVDDAYEQMGNRAEGEPHANDTYDIYQFFASDPEGRTVEFQTFE
ncbi:VOC family protein [Natronorubrum sp. JWXQ-INN-674]|uniref:VOC family protein n=1 Tax=Natronorubrum halalkaliphilum TaxID=2691917 RepID=A0A6B0VRF8_9EURY|nr:VOC family protein [Natronorubrum halalkaliphilum]MXV64240.1 VOC family protein [Natronorubrum halalkaliphilum]